MKFLSIAMLCLFSSNSFSNEKHQKEMEKKMDNMSFEDAKKMKLEMMEEKSTMMEQKRKCILESTDKAGLKECMKEMHDKKSEMKNKMYK